MTADLKDKAKPNIPAPEYLGQDPTLQDGGRAEPRAMPRGVIETGARPHRRERKRRRSFTAEMKAIIHAGLYPRLVTKLDGSEELTALPASAVSGQDEADDLGSRMQQIGGVRGGKVR